jgi:hypothetical protein
MKSFKIFCESPAFKVYTGKSIVISQQQDGAIVRKYTNAFISKIPPEVQPSRICIDDNATLQEFIDTYSLDIDTVDGYSYSWCPMVEKLAGKIPSPKETHGLWFKHGGQHSDVTYYTFSVLPVIGIHNGAYKDLGFKAKSSQATPVNPFLSKFKKK